VSIEHEISCSVLDGGCAFCGVTVQEYAVNGVTYSWRKGSHLRVALDFDDLGALAASQVKDAVVAALKEISDCCDITHELVASSLNANLKVILARLDGKMGVLADCQLPQPGSSPDSVQLLMRIDTSERWGLSTNPTGDMIDFYRVFLHEALHGHGLGHKPNSVRDPALIAPMYSPLIRNLQAADKSELVRRYSAPQVKPAPPVPSPAGAPAEIPVVVTATTPWGQYSAKGPLKPVRQSIYTDRFPTGPVILPPFIEQDENLP
jgi:hypothetical protein